MLGYEEGNSDKVEIRASEETWKSWKRMCADIDPSLTQEQVLHIVLSTYEELPGSFEKKS